jgi:serine/threonine protein kinase
MVKQLVVIAGKDKGRIFPLPESGSLSIGRGNSTDTRLTDARVSRNHCTLQIDGDSFDVADAGSAIGTFVNDQRVNGEHPVEIGDIIRIGDTELRLEDGDVAEAETVAGVMINQQTMQRVGVGRTAGPLSDLVGTTLGHYELASVVGRGLSGIVFRGNDTTEARTAAVKVLQPAATKTDGEMQRLNRSLKAVVALRHPNLVGLYDLGKDHGHCWFAMELVEGENLAQVIQRVGLAGMLDWQHALRVAMHVGRALEYLEKNKVLHRAITPRSILINNSDKLAKLGGLWHARSLETTEPEAPSRGQDFLRDVAYLSPEQVRGEGVKDNRSDIYAFGATLYTLLTGRAPFEGKSPPETIAKVLQAQPARPKEFQLALPEVFEALVLRMLAKQPKERFPTAAALLADLERIAKDPTGTSSARNGPGLPKAAAEDDDGVIPVLCACGQRLQARKKCAGTEVRCPTCGNFLLVPGQAPVGQMVAPASRPAVPLRPMPEKATLPTKPSSTPPWLKVVLAAVGAIAVLAALAWMSGLFGSFMPGPAQPNTSPTKEESQPVRNWH